MGLIRNCLRAGDLGVAVLVVGAELTRGMTTKEHFQGLKDIARDTYQESRDKGSGRAIAALKAAYEAYQCDKAVTAFKWVRAVGDLITEMILPVRFDQRMHWEAARPQIVYVAQEAPRASGYGMTIDERAQARPIR